jgi:signal transduction histidine kinase/ActR/RegA family two-component response regulator
LTAISNTDRKRYLTRQYMVAIFVMAILSSITLISFLYVLHQQEDYAYIINISGRQRMLSQRTTLQMYKFMECENCLKMEEIRKVLLNDISLMQSSHESLVSGRLKDQKSFTPSKAIHDMYYGDGLGVDSLVKDHLNNIHALTEAKITDSVLADNQNLRDEIFHSATMILLPALDKIVKQYELESNLLTQRLLTISFLIFIFTLVALAAIVVKIFRPLILSIVKNENLLNTILDNVPILMDIVGDDAKILYQSKFLKDTLGENSIGKTCYEVYKDDKKQCHRCPLLDKDFTEQNSVLEIPGCLGGRILQVSHIDIIFQGQRAVLEVFQDLTQQNETERLLVSAKEQAENASSLKSEFLANMSHEIRTPLNGIIGFTDVLLESELSSQQNYFAELLKDSGGTLLALVNDILDFSKIEAGKLDMENVEFSLSGIFNKITQIYATKIDNTNLSINYNIEPLNRNIISDPVRLQQILTNLISNAVKFTKEGGITVNAKQINEFENTIRIKFSVQDTGIGIPAERQKHIFEAFSQSDSSITRKFGGTGLGLTISNKLVDLLGGTCLCIESVEEKGTTFSFDLDFNLGGQIVNNEGENARSPETAKTPDLNILLVEDNKINTILATQLLTKMGHTVTTAENGEEGFKAAVNGNFDIVFMDMMMPVMDGLSATRKIRSYEIENKTEKKILIAAMTANAMKGDEFRCIEAGMNDYITKPLSRDLLSALLSRWFAPDRLQFCWEFNQCGREPGGHNIKSDGYLPGNIAR